MSVKQIAASIQALPPAERAEIIEWMEIHRAELMADTEAESPAVRAELELRLKEISEHPELLEPFEEEDLDRMFEEFANARTKTTSPR